MTDRHYNRLENGPMDDIDATIFSGDTFHNRENIAAFRDQIALGCIAYIAFGAIVGFMIYCLRTAG
jgi:hypothetical protein